MPVTRLATGATKRNFRDPSIDGEEPEECPTPEAVSSEEESRGDQYQHLIHSAIPPAPSKLEGPRRGRGRPRKIRLQGKEGVGKSEPDNLTTTSKVWMEQDGYGDKGIPSRVAQSVREQTSRVPSWLKDTAKRKKARFSYAFSENLRDGLPLAVAALRQVTFDENWTEENEVELAAAWIEEKNEWAIDANRKPNYRKLWTWCLAFMECTPWDIVGIRNGFLYERSKAGRPKNNVSNVWTASFCHKFAYLIPHTMWKSRLPHGRAKRLILALQYAVILRTNDQRPWNPEIVEDEFLNEFKSMLMEQDPTSPIDVREIHAQTMQRLGARGKEPSNMSDLFTELENTIETPELPLSQAGNQMFVVTLKDVRSLTNALDNMTDPDTGMRMFFTTEVIATSSTEPVQKNLLPSYDEIEQWHELAMKDQFRAILRLERD